ncbi:hypothetical protein HY990_01920 [Candidatus Micrarchaeota archaeon]|nr:hypothetical protein [Candidatus Micrarchaeota archaeon]
MQDLRRVFEYSTQDYLEKYKLIQLFSIPFVIAFFIPILAAAPTYLAFGGIFLRTGSLPDLSGFDIGITILGYAISVFLISDTIVNLNIITKSKRTMTNIKSEIMNALATYGLRIFAINTAVVIILFILQILTYELPGTQIIYPLISLAVAYILFFIAPAIVIDDSGIMEGLVKSATMAIKKPIYIGVWILLAFVLFSIVKLIGDFVLGSFSGYFVLLVNALLVLPFLTVLQTHMYMEKYPLAR